MSEGQNYRDLQNAAEALGEITQSGWPAMLTLDGLDDAIINAIPKNENYVIVYDRGLIVDILVQEDNMSYEDAEEFTAFNIDCLYAGIYTPIIVGGE